MSRRPKDIGTAAETAVVRHLQASGFPQAERRALRGHLDCGDVTGTPGICWEVKGGAAAKTASDGLVDDWLADTETERVNAAADVGVLVMQRAAFGPARAGRWWAVVPGGVYAALATRTEARYWSHLVSPVRLHLTNLVVLLRVNGYGEPLEAAP